MTLLANTKSSAETSVFTVLETIKRKRSYAALHIAQTALMDNVFVCLL